MRTLGFVSDEMYLALAGVDAEFESVATGEITVLRSSPRGAFYGDLADGTYRVALAKDTYGSKNVTLTLGPGAPPHQFRLMSSNMAGYMWPKWVRGGDTAQFRVHSVEPYELSLWRYGLHRERIQTVTWMDEHGPQANRQILPDGDFTQTGVQWNTIGYAAPPTLQAPERSGLYYLWARCPSGKAYSFPWIVAPREPKAKIAVLASTNAWNAYNNFGGRSNYVNADKLPDRPVVNSRQELNRYQDFAPFGVWRPKDEEYLPLSFDRPDPNCELFDNPEVTDPARGRTQCGMAPGEWRLYGWLEREGFEYDLYSETQLHDGTLPLDAYSVVITAVHPEYWTREMYFAIKKWVFERGGRFMYLGGNGLNCEVVLEGTAMRCLTHLWSEKGEMGGPAPDGTMYESRMHRTLGDSEAALLGVVCSETGIMTSAPYKVLDASHWIFEGTGLANGDIFGEKTLHERIPGGASGHETDKRSPSSPANTLLLAKGTNIDDGGSEITLHEPPGKGGAVFSVGSITWVSALFTDANVSAITRNVIRRFLP